jgi:hypothetical protein
MQLHMWLAPASKPFILVFPDGYRMSGAMVSKKLILEHAPSIGELRQVSAERFLFRATLGGTVLFTFHADDLIEMEICVDYALPRAKPAISFEAPGGEVVSWPLRQSDMSRLFGEPITVRRDSALLWFGC